MNTTAATTPPAHQAFIEWSLLLLGYLALFIPTYVELAQTLWLSNEQGQGPIVLLVAAWFVWQKRHYIHELPSRPVKFAGSIIFSIGLICYVLGRSQDILVFEVGAQIPILAGLLLVTRGWAAVKAVWFPLLFLIFMVPLPGAFVDALTMPMKIAVSYAAEHILYWADYPVSRSGVIINIGQYKLLVADACAGLHTLFTLEALGLLYLHLVRHESVARNIALAVLIVPISFSANTLRVICLTLITYYYGDDAGQGFVHDFAGMVLFLSALILIIAVDSLLQLITRMYQKWLAEC